MDMDWNSRMAAFLSPLNKPIVRKGQVWHRRHSTS
jgi:hypothetical protein